MATSDFWQRLSVSPPTSSEWEGPLAGSMTRGSGGAVALWMVMDAVTVLASVVLATLYERHMGLLGGARDFWHGTLIHGRSMRILLALFAEFTCVLLVLSRRIRLYAPTRISGILHEQSLSFQACFTAGLLLTGTLYFIHGDNIPRKIVALTIGFTALGLSLRRFIYRFMLYRRFDRGVGARNVLIVGTGPEAHALRHHIESIRHLGYAFKGFIDLPGSRSRFSSASAEIVGTLDTLFQNARKEFVEEIFFTTPCEPGIVQSVLEQARTHGVDLRVIPDMYDGLAWNSPIEYIGQFPTIPLHCGRVPELGLLLKRTFDIVFSVVVLIALAPFMIAIAIAIRLDSPGPALYSSERIGKKGIVFRCTKFRTMVCDAEKRRADVMHMNERDGVLFKISNDPRITSLGRFLRKYSLDELPQFFSVLKGDMSVVGPRPPIASEVREYKLSHLRRLDVTPGITGLWQVQGRQDPSFASYVSLDVNYIDNWSVWLDFKIIIKTIGVVFAGTGT